MRTSLNRLAGWTALAALAGCTVGPNYHRPTAPVSPRFKEAAGWAPSQPADAIDRGAWWSMFHDAQLDSLEQRVATSNQTVAQYEAAYREAHQVVAEARSSFFPTIGAEGSATHSREPNGISSLGTTGAGTTGTGTSTSTTGTSSGTTGSTGTTGAGATTTSSSGTSIRTTYVAELEASWVPDLWGKVRRTVESDTALAQASAADLANARLAAQGSLAEDYFALRVLDEQSRLYHDTVADYQKFLTVTTNQYTYGTQARSAVITAQTQLYAAQAQLIDVGVRRSAMEHAIAVLVGVPPAALTITPATFARDVPVAPTDVASSLLERRPDIAAAERRMASANALVGVAVSAYYPSLTLSGDYGSGASSIGSLFTSAASLWSVGAELADTLIDFGARRARVREQRAAYDESVATYRQTVLTAFQGVEDELSALHVYQQEQAVLLQTEASARQAVQLDLNQYREGTVDYTTVITAQATALTASQNVLTVLQERLQSSVVLVEDLGGGWSARDLPKS
ncbi:efflux transporter outer membrane subunit [uncultured Sphingomonas sp.]|uniref:efflux transporter outer membrane subunit n=1 Tax=uncultured Sphingomonas sp. TaxID=158754 RepID=UPI002636E3B5|nr:efflux transporter outer membrane subunit [uncultured Sphingomonas sp.]